MSSLISFIQPEAVRELLKNADQRRKIVILDVREDDFAGGHIKGCRNIPSFDFRGQTVDVFINSLSEETERVIVHCFFSQQRGPMCAHRLAQRLLDMERGGKPQVHVLAHGWRRFGALFGEDKEICVVEDATL